MILTHDIVAGHMGRVLNLELKFAADPVLSAGGCRKPFFDI